MDDCNLGLIGRRGGGEGVQIPLWTIVTSGLSCLSLVKVDSSDSSMDDCNFIQVLLCLHNFPRSDSSMDDCNVVDIIKLNSSFFVQIPLWTIVTEVDEFTAILKESSDSSMDDCNIKTPPEYYADKDSSDSSMDDCNVEYKAACSLAILFRFLYGRL